MTQESDNSPVLVTGGAGFIGSNFILQWLFAEQSPIVNLDKLTYAGNLANLEGVSDNARYTFVHGDIGDRPFIRELLQHQHPRAIVHFAAETHVDRSIHGPDDFIRANVNGTFNLLQESLGYWNALRGGEKDRFRFVQISTDEVYGSLGPNDPAFAEQNAYQPNSPYSASKAAADHLVRAYHHTYGLPTLTTNCSNNYGPYQFPEKLIPLVILNAASGKPIPVYGDGKNVRDWLYVGDHCSAVRTLLDSGRVGQTYNVGGGNEKVNLEIVETICAIMDELRPSDPVIPHRDLITFVPDRPGHDRRYAINPAKIEREVGWRASETFASGIRKTIEWYMANEAWTRGVNSGAYRQWIATQYSL